MRRVVVRPGGEVVLESVALPEVGPGAALVRMRMVGICGSDIHAAQGSHPFVPLPYSPGHEVVGVVERSGAGGTLAPGTRVVIEPILSCGECKYCRDGRYNLCRTQTFFGCTAPEGGMADYLVLPEDRLHVLPTGMSDEQAVLVEPFATPVHAVELAGGDLTGRSVAVIGAGTIGLLTLSAVRQANAARVVVLDPLPDKRRLALRMGADTAYDPATPDLVATVRADLGESADVVFDCVAIQGTVDSAVALALKGGTVVVIGVPVAPVTVALPQIQDLQVRLQGSATYVRADFLRALELVAAGVLDPADFVTASYPLADAAAAFAAAASGQHVKVVVLGSSSHQESESA